MKIEKIEMESIWEPYCQSLENSNGRELNMTLHAPDWFPEPLRGTGFPEEAMSNRDQELQQYLELFRPCFRSDQKKYATAYIKGLMSDLEYKSVEPIALRYGLPVRGTQRFLNCMKWPDQQMWDIYRSCLARVIAGGGGMITVDRHETPKKGKHSIGVAHQYCGAMGKVANCQSGVYVGYSGERGHGLIDCSLYLPELWFDEGHKKLREKCGVPEGTTFRTKASMAAEMVQKAHLSGLYPAQWIGMDSFFGDSKEFLSAIPKGMWYLADAHPDALVFREMPTMAIPAYSGRGRRSLKIVPSPAPVAVGDIVGHGNPADSSVGHGNPADSSVGHGNPADSSVGHGNPADSSIGHGNPANGSASHASPANSSADGTQAHLGEGPKSSLIAYEKCIRVIRCENNIPSEEVWLYIHKLQGETHKYSFCNAPPDTPVSVIRRAALMRHPMGQCFEDCKSRLGLDQCEGRSWNTWYRHNLLVFVAHLFLTCLRHNYANSYLSKNGGRGS